MQRVHAEVSDADEGKRIAQQRQNCSCTELFQRCPEIELKPSGEENQDERERSKSTGHLAELRTVHPVQHRTESNSCDQQNDHVGDARPFR